MVPSHIQADVYKAYRRGQCNDKEPSAAWFRVADQAIVHVAMQEDILTAEQAAKYLGSREKFYQAWAKRMAEPRAGRDLEGK